MNAPQIVFVQFPSAAHVGQWRAHALGILAMVGTDLRLASPGPKVVWHLASANHRPLARSVQAFDDFESAYADAVDVSARSTQLTTRQHKLDAQLGYGWAGLLDGRAAVMCSRAYSTVRDNRDSVASALVAFPLAHLGAAPRAHAIAGRVR